MKMKKMIVLLITMFLSSCQISSNSEPSSEQNSDSISTIESISNLDVLSDESLLVEQSSMPSSESTEGSSSEEVEDIYYLDGLPSNLFVTDIMEEYMTFTYYEDYDFYQVTVSPKVEKMLGKELEGQDIVIPNVYDDGIHGLKRVKAFTICRFEEGYLNSLIVSEGIEMCALKINISNESRLVHNSLNMNPIKNIYLPSTITYLSDFFQEYSYCWYNPKSNDFKFEPNIYYNGTIEQWNNIEFVEDFSTGIYSKNGNYKFAINCLDGISYVKDCAGIDF